MGNSFFVAFCSCEGEKELFDIVNSLNMRSGMYNLVVLTDGVHSGKKSYFVGRIGKVSDSTKYDTSSYGILWRKYFMMSNAEEYGVFFYDEEYERKRFNVTVATA